MTNPLLDLTRLLNKSETTTGEVQFKLSDGSYNVKIRNGSKDVQYYGAASLTKGDTVQVQGTVITTKLNSPASLPIYQV